MGIQISPSKGSEQENFVSVYGGAVQVTRAYARDFHQAAAGRKGTLLRMKARGQATGASTTMHTLMIHTVLAPNLQVGTGTLLDTWCAATVMLSNAKHLMRAALLLIHILCTRVSRHRQLEVAHQRPCRLQKA